MGSRGPLFKGWSFRAQLAVTFGSVTLLLVLLLGVAAENRERDRLNQQSNESYEQLVSVLKVTLADAIVAEDSALMSELTSRLGTQDRRLLRIEIVDERGVVLNRWSRNEVSETSSETTFKSDVLLNGQTIGHILLVKDPRMLKAIVDQRVFEVRLVMIASLLVVAIVVALIVWRLGGSINQAFAQTGVPQVRTNLEGKVLETNELGRRVLNELTGIETDSDLSRFVPTLFGPNRKVHDEVEVGRRTYSVHVVTMTEFNSVYLTFNDVTESRILTLFPSFNPNPVLKMTPEGLVTFANAAGRSLLDGWGTSVGEFVPAEVQSKFVLTEEPVKLTVASGDRVFDLDLVYVPALDFINAFGTDMTHVVQLEEARERLVQKEKLAVLGGLVAGVAHELNTPIGVALTAARLVQEEALSLREQFEGGRLVKSAFVSSLGRLDEVANLVVSNSNRAAQLIESFKGVAVDQSNAAVRSLELRPYLQQIVTSLGPYLNRQSVVVEIEGPDFPLKIPAGPFSQVITNLLQNAAVHAYDGRGGTVSIVVHPPLEGRFKLDVRDSGKGIKAELLPRVFEPLFTTRLGSGGSGLGLHICYQIVQDVLRGTLTVESEEGVGTQFTLELPIDYIISGAFDSTAA